MHRNYDLSTISSLLDSYTISLRSGEIETIRQSRNYLEREIIGDRNVHYGINTGFGSLCDVQIPQDELRALQVNLIRSHACGTGKEVSPRIVRIMILLKILGLSSGYSGVRVELVEHLIQLYNKGITPVIYEQGSLGASGDLAPLAHLGLVMIGEGEAYYKGNRYLTREIFHRLNISPLTIEAKEGLAILNGTQFSTAHAVHTILEAQNLLQFAHLAATLSIESFNCSPSPFDPLLHEIRNQDGQQLSARLIRDLLRGSDIGFRDRYSIQDPYSFRCIPQVLGASIDALKYTEQIITKELNGVTDNPNIFWKADKIISGGNFHAQPIALINDFMALALAEIGNLAERRVFQLVNGSRDLPKFLSPNPGTHSGMMIAQYTAASIVSQNKQYCSPASIDSIPSNMNQEDHVSMAANAGTKLIPIIDNLKTILAIEWMCAAQALDFRQNYRLNVDLQRLHDDYRRNFVPRLKDDRALYVDIQKTREFITSRKWNKE